MGCSIPLFYNAIVKIVVSLVSYANDQCNAISILKSAQSQCCIVIIYAQDLTCSPKATVEHFVALLDRQCDYELGERICTVAYVAYTP